MDGMVAVVRGLRDAGLAVTLLDNGKQFTLAPNCYNQPADEKTTTSSTMQLLQMQQGLNPHVQQGITPHMAQIPHMPNVPIHMPYSNVAHSSHMQPITHSPHASHASHLRTTATDAMPDRVYNNSATQAIDGRYASVYQTTVCKMKPTNPPVQLTEFPPQRPGRESLPGQDNFIVGGTGSGDTTYAPVRIPNNYRGAMCWTDRRSVCSPRPSRQPDAFASSLRKYPNRMSPERSSEIVERLITYTQAKNYNKSPPRYQAANSQTRSFEIADQVEERKCKSPSKLVCRGVDSPRPRFCEESPTREKTKRVELDSQDYKRSTYSRSYDVRYLRDMSRIVRDNMKSVSCNPYHQPVCPIIRERHDTPPSTRQSMPEQSTPSMVNSEIQAAAQMICREVSTTPRIDPPKRHVAVALTPDSTQPSEGAVSLANIHKSVQANGHARKSVQTTLSCIEISSESLISHTRKSKSEEDIRNRKSLHCQILEKLEEIFLHQELKFLRDKAEDIRRYVIDNKDNNAPKPIEDVPKTFSDFHSEYDENGLAYRRKLSKDLATNMKQIGNKNFNVYCAEITNFMICNNHIRRVICDWLNEIPLKPRDFLGRAVNKDEILSYIVCRLKIVPKGALFNKRKFRTEILDIVDDIPVDVENCNKTIYSNKLAEDLISRLEHAKIRDFYNETIPNKFKYPKNEFIVNTATTFKRFIRPSEDEIREFVKKELVESIQNSQLDIDASKVGDIESDLVEVLLDTLEDVSNSRDEEVVNEITTLLRNTGQLLKNQAEIFSNMLIKKLKKRFFHATPNECIDNFLHIQGQNKSDSDADLKETEITQKTFGNKEVNDKHNEPCKNGHCDTPTSSQVTGSNNEGDAKSNIDAYVRQLSKEIDQWLSSIATEVPKVHDRSFRHKVIRDLAEDVVDRRKYLQINPTSLVTEKDELEHFKYQIYKWINKVVGENNMHTLEKAPDLMKRIRSIPVPVLTKRSRRSTKIQNSTASSSQPSRRPSSATQNDPTPTSTKCTMSSLETPPDESDELSTEPAKQDRGAEANQSDIYFDILRRNRSYTPVMRKSKPIISHNMRNNVMVTVQQTTGVPSNAGIAPAPQPAMNYLTPTPNLKQLNDEYDEFLKAWTQSIPFPPNTDPDLAEKMRQGLYHGIWKAVAKIKSSPATLTNQFFYEDVLDDEIEELFSLVPPTEELQKKKHLLKVELIEKTSHINEMIKLAHAPETFGQKLVDSVSVYVPRTETNLGGEDPIKVFEEVKILFLTDEYILYTRYKDEDPIKSNVYRSKLLRHIQEFVSDIKRLHNKELKDVDEELYMNEILTAMQQVPLPSNETVKQEADEILLGMEIDKWFSDLPLAPNEDAIEQLKRRRLRDILAKRLYELEKQTSFAENTDELALRHEVSQVLEKLPLGKDESLKINFMVDELTNRIKNRDRGARGPRRSTVMFNESIAYNDFAKPACCMQGNSSPIRQQQQQIQVPEPDNLNETSKKWIGPPSAAIHPQPTSAMQDAAGRMWYSFDERKPSFGPEDAPCALHESLGQGPIGGPLPLSQQAAQALAQSSGSAAMPGEQPKANATNQSFWLSKYLEKVEAKTKGYEERGMTTQGLGEAPWPFIAAQPDVCGMQNRQGAGQPGMGQSMGGQGPMGQSMGGQGPMGQNMGGTGPMGQSMRGQGPMGQSMGGQGPMGQSMGGQGPMGQSMGGQGPIGQGMGGQEPIGQGMGGQGPMGQSMGGPGLMGQSMGGQGPIGQSMGGQPQGPWQSMSSQSPMDQSIGAQQSMGPQGPMDQSMGAQGARKSMGAQGARQSMGAQGQIGQSGAPRQSMGCQGMRQSMAAQGTRQSMGAQGARPSMGAQGQMGQPGAGRQSMAGQGMGPAQQDMPGQDTGASFGPASETFKSMDMTDAPQAFYPPGAQGAPRQSVGKQGAMPGAAAGAAPRQSIAQGGRRPSTPASTSRKSVQLVDGRRPSVTKSPGRQSAAKPREPTPASWNQDTVYGSLNETKAPAAMWNQQPQQLQQQPMTQQMPQQPMPQQSAGQPMQPGQPTNVGPSGQPPNQDGSMWLDKYMTHYQAAHPPIPATPPGLQQSYQYPQNQNSVQFGPQRQDTSVLEPPEYGAFGQERPISSSYQQVVDRSVGPPLVPQGQVSGMQQMPGELNASGIPFTPGCKTCESMSSGVPTPMPPFVAGQAPVYSPDGSPVGSAGPGSFGPAGPRSGVLPPGSFGPVGPGSGPPGPGSFGPAGPGSGAPPPGSFGPAGPGSGPPGPGSFGPAGPGSGPPGPGSFRPAGARSGAPPPGSFGPAGPGIGAPPGPGSFGPAGARSGAPPPFSGGVSQAPGAGSFGGGAMPVSGAPSQYGGVSYGPEMQPVVGPGSFAGGQGPGGRDSYIGPAEQDMPCHEGGVCPHRASLQQGVGSGVASVAETGQQAPGFYRSTDREGIQMFTEQNKGARSTASGTDNIGPYMPAGYSTPEQPIQGPYMPQRPQKSRGTQKMICVRRRLDFNDTDDDYDSRCRCLEKMKKFKPRPCFNRDCVDMPRALRYFSPYYPPPCHPPYPYY